MRTPEAERYMDLGYEGFGAKKSHEPDGLMAPSTILQLVGGWNCRHRSQRMAARAASL
jgi:hypothetical protein